MDFFRKPIFLIILAAALIAAGVWAYISNRGSQTTSTTTTTTTTTSTTTETISNLTNADASTLADGIAAQLALADAKAAEVDKKLQLAAIEVDLPATMDQNSGSTYYIYTSTSDTLNNWVIAISNSDNKFVRSRTVKADSNKKSEVEEKVKALKDVMNEENAEVIKNATEALSASLQELGASMYKQAEAEQQTSAAGEKSS